jgi:hypothetical protein
MEIRQDFKELLELLNTHKVEYVVVGGHALAFHGAPRYTGDIDILVKPDGGNAAKVMAALKDFGFGSMGLNADDFQTPGQIIQLGFPPVRVDIITSVSGVSWEEIFDGKAAGSYGPVNVSYIGRRELIRNKKATGRKKDLADVEALGEQ